MIRKCLVLTDISVSPNSLFSWSAGELLCWSFLWRCVSTWHGSKWNFVRRWRHSQRNCNHTTHVESWLSWWGS